MRQGIKGGSLCRPASADMKKKAIDDATTDGKNDGCAATHDRAVEELGQLSDRQPFFRASFVVLIALVTAGRCYGHALTPFHYPLGPYPVWVASEIWYLIPALAAAILVEVLLLKLLVRRVSFVGNVWRGLVLHLSARGVEFALLFTGLGQWGWTGNYRDTFVSTLMLLGGGMTVRTLLAKGLYKRQEMRWRRAAAAGILTGATGYSVILLFALSEVIRFLS